ncbi:Chloroperoxidase [Mucor mucedo]|uniref:Chloroperoxidase n=1 Tax=Mucor mucedo TaxID=29922 RepID=UPI00221ED40C|nr:Chloroperoxidase [Mucor mucedo]KAI7889617.1 Chloroperoxidase [Mucor mucedo]
MIGGKYQKLDADEHRKGHKSKSLKTLAISIGLGLVVAYAVISVLIIEVKGRQALKTPEEWRELIKEHGYERQETDARSPCPMLNTLANHGFIARSGRHIKSDDLFKAMMLMGAPPTVTAGFLKKIYRDYHEADPQRSFFSQFSSMETLDLDRLTVAGLLEHDVSLSRNDLRLPPYSTVEPIPDYVHRMHKIAQVANKGTEFEGIFTRKNENDARRIRWLESYGHNKYIHLSLFHQFASSTECSLLLDIIGRDGAITLPHLTSFLLNQTFPDDWHPRETSYSFKELATKPLRCWKGLRDSTATLELLDQLEH